MLKLQLLLPRGLRRVLRFAYHRVHRRDPVLQNSMHQLRALQGQYAGQRCFIMGNGPSLNQTNLHKLAGEYVWGVNRCYLLFDRIDWRPAFYVAIDTRVVPDIAPELQTVISSLPDTRFFLPAEFYMRGVLRHQPNILWFFQVNPHKEEGVPGYFSLDPPRYLRTANTVTISALQLAIYMGFNPIYLIGCDTMYTIPPGVKAEGQGFDGGTKEKLEGYNLTSTADNDPNHFDTRYFGTNARWHHPNVNGMLFGYQMVSRACVGLNVQVYNATVGGKLEVFPRVAFDTLF